MSLVLHTMARNTIICYKQPTLSHYPQASRQGNEPNDLLVIDQGYPMAEFKADFFSLLSLSLYNTSLFLFLSLSLSLSLI